MKKLIAALAIAGIAGLTACTPVNNAPSPSGTTPATGSSASATPSASSSAGASGVKGSCELFNSLIADYRAVKADDADGYDGIYLRSEDAKDAASGDLKGLFAALSLLALDRSLGEAPSQQARDAIRDAVFANGGACSAEDVTLKL